MKKQLQKFGTLPIGNVLSKDEQKMITGGQDSGYLRVSCTCSYGIGSWTGYYSSWGAVTNAVGMYCPQGTGTCCY